MFRYIVILVVFDLLAATVASFVPLLMLTDLISNDVGILNSIAAHDEPEEFTMFILDLMIFIFAGVTGLFYSFERNFKSRRLGPFLLAATGLCLLLFATGVFLLSRQEAGYGGEI